MRVAHAQMRLVDRHRPGRGFHLRLKVVNGGHHFCVAARRRREDKTEHDAENHEPPAHRLLSLLKKGTCIESVGAAHPQPIDGA